MPKPPSGPSTTAPPSVLCRWLFLRLLGLVYLIALLSFWSQVDGLIGSNGILPAGEFLEAVHERFGATSYRLLPTLCWLDRSDRFLHLLCGGGVVASLLLVLNVAPALAALLAWAAYLSLFGAGQDFMSFQWDILLLEAGFLGVLFAPWKLWPRRESEPPPDPIATWLVRWLLFRLMFASGAVKLLSGDPSWQSFTALEFHYETQPLPTALGWYAHALPAWFQRLSCGLMFLVELGLPILILLGRRARLVAFFGFTGLQLLIAATGNYCFFNLLSLALGLSLLDDAALRRALPRALWSGDGPVRAAEPGLKRPVLALAGGFLFLLSAVQFSGQMLGRSVFPGFVRQAVAMVTPLRLSSTYGLFAVMTTRRLEIEVQGTADGQTWRPYRFRFKPDDPMERPRLVAPHQPRLDWQMWFAALGSVEQNPWFMRFLVQLLRGSPQVLELLSENPFPDGPPRAVRALLHEYRFTDPAMRRATGAWWRREDKGLYCPAIGLSGSGT